MYRGMLRGPMDRGWFPYEMLPPIFTMNQFNCNKCPEPEPGRLCYLNHKICEGYIEMYDLCKTFKKGTSVKLTNEFYDEYRGEPNFTKGKTYKVSRHYGRTEAFLMDPETGKDVNTGSVRFKFLELASREDHAKFILEEANELQEKVNQMKIKAERLMKYKTDEEEAASIISDIVKSNGDQAKILEIIRSSGVEISLVK